MRQICSSQRCLRADSRLAPSQWEMALQSNAVFHWLGANLESALCLYWFRWWHVTWLAPDQYPHYRPGQARTVGTCNLVLAGAHLGENDMYWKTSQISNLRKYHLSSMIRHRCLKSFLMEHTNMFIQHFQYHGCWWPGSWRRQGISSNGIDLLYWEYPSLSTRRVI